MAYAIRLRTKIDASGHSVRSFATAWAEISGRKPEYARADVYKYLRGQEPTARIAQEHAAALGVPVKDLTGEDDEEEESDFVDAVKQLQAVAAALALTVEKLDRHAKRNVA